jgi:hypothetical protein
LTAWKIDGLGLFWSESIYLIDSPELKPVGFVWIGCPPNRKSHVALGRLAPGWAVGLKSQILNPSFSRAPPPRLSWIRQNLDGAIIYWHLFCFPRHSGSRSKPDLLLPASSGFLLLIFGPVNIPALFVRFPSSIVSALIGASGSPPASCSSLPFPLYAGQDPA